jgi:hypothetical protein
MADYGRVEALVVDGWDVHLYLVEVSTGLAGEVTAAWVTWNGASEGA